MSRFHKVPSRAIILMVFVVSGCGKKSGLEGKVLDGKGQPIARINIIAKQVQPIKGYEQFESTTGADGSFSFKKLFPTSEYILFPWYSDWEEAPMKTLSYEVNKLIAHFNKEGWTTKQKMKVKRERGSNFNYLLKPTQCIFYFLKAEPQIWIFFYFLT